MTDDLNERQKRVKMQIEGYTLGAISGLLMPPVVFLYAGNIGVGLLALALVVMPAYLLWSRVFTRTDEFDYCEYCGRVGCDGRPCYL